MGHLYSNGIVMNTKMKKLKEISLTHLLIGGVRIATPSIMIRKQFGHTGQKTKILMIDWLMIA